MKLIMPQRPILSVVEGAAYFGITPNYIKARVLQYTYGYSVSKLESIAQQIASAQHIKENRVYNKYRDAYYVKNMFEVLARKGEEIYAGQIKEGISARAKPSKMRTTQEIYYSHMVEPKVRSDGISIGKCILDWDDQNPLNMEMKTEFHFYDTIIKVVCYPTNAPYKKQTKHITMPQQHIESMEDCDISVKLKQDLENYMDDFKHNNDENLFIQLRSKHDAEAEIIRNWKHSLKNQHYQELFDKLLDKFEDQWKDEAGFQKLTYGLLFGIIITSYEVLKREYAEWNNNKYVNKIAVNMVLLNIDHLYDIFQRLGARRRRIENIYNYIMNKIVNVIYEKVRANYTYVDHKKECEGDWKLFIVKCCKSIWNVLNHGWDIYPTNSDGLGEEHTKYNGNKHVHEGLNRGDDIQYCVFPALIQDDIFHTKMFVVCNQTTR